MANGDSLSSLFPAPDDLTIRSAEVARVGRGVAWKIISNYEWLGTLPPCTDYYGVFFGGVCGGVGCWSVGSAGSAMMIAPMLGVTQHELAYLCRGACVHWAPVGTAPRLINMSVKLLAAQKPVKVCIAYSDTDAGEIGTVYQASGWICIGLGISDYEWVTPSGVTRNRSTTRDVANRNGASWAEATAILEAAGWTRQAKNRKWRYVKLTPRGMEDSELIGRVQSLKTPYPKRQPVEGGCTPAVERRGRSDPDAPSSE